MSEPLAVNRSNPLLNVATAVGVALLAGGGFTLSFASLRDLAIASGIPEELAFIWPLIVDGFIVVATAAAFVLGRSGRRATWYPWAALMMFSAISVAGNALHATEASLRVPIAVATIVSAVPAIALLIASHLLVVMVSSDGREKSRAPKRLKAAASSAPARAEDKQVLLAPISPGTTTREVTAETAAPKPRSKHASGGRAALEARVREAIAGGTHVTGSMAAEWADVPLTTAKRWLNDIKKTIAAEDAASEIPTIGAHA